MNVDIVKGIPFFRWYGRLFSRRKRSVFCASKLFGISIDEMMPLALKVGCDVPFMIFGGAARVQGVGEIITPVEIQPLTLVIAQKTVGSSTKDIYKSTTRRAENVAKRKKYFNALERGAVLLNPQIADAKADLLKHTQRVFMTGSGSAYVGVLTATKKRSNVWRGCKATYFASWLIPSRRE